MDPRICDVWDVREQIVVVVDSETGVSYVIMWNLLLSLIVTHLHSKQYWHVQCCSAVGSKVSNPYEGFENVSHAEICFSVYENVVRLPISTAIVVLIRLIYHVKTLISYSWTVHLSRNWHACRPGGLSFVVLFNFFINAFNVMLVIVMFMWGNSFFCQYKQVPTTHPVEIGTHWINVWR